MLGSVKIQSSSQIDTNNKRQGGYDVTTPKRVRISGTTVARRTKFGHNVHHTQAVVISGSDVEWDPGGPLGSQKTVSIKRVCEWEPLLQKLVCEKGCFLAQRCEV